MEIKTVSMRDYSSLCVGGECKLLEVKNIEELKEALMFVEQKGLRMHILGQGTNSYFGEDLSSFLFVKLELRGISFLPADNDCYVTSSASEIWDDVVSFAVEKGLRGVENLSYIPGTVGAAPVQNIGAYGAELADTFLSCEVFDTADGTVKTLNKEACHFGYRDSIFKHKVGRYIILSVTLVLSRDRPFTLTYKPLDELVDKENLSVKEVREKVIDVRRSKLPEWKVNPNCGSFFKNPVITTAHSEELRRKYPVIPLINHGDAYKVPAAWLIDHIAEMKGTKVGSLRTWDKQALVLVNDDDATADDVDAFVEDIKERVRVATGIILEQEVNRVGSSK